MGKSRCIIFIVYAWFSAKNSSLSIHAKECQMNSCSTCVDVAWPQLNRWSKWNQLLSLTNLHIPPISLSLSPFLFSSIEYNFLPSYTDNATADAYLMTFVNLLGVATFSSIVLYHFITARAKDAEVRMVYFTGLLSVALFVHFIVDDSSFYTLPITWNSN